MNLTQEKIVNGIKYFVNNTNNVGRTKLFKLLFFWDFLYFKKYGKSITGYDYFTYPFGPVPKELFNQIIQDKLPSYLEDHFLFEEVKKDDDYDDQYKKFLIKPKRSQYDLSCFSQSEKEVLEEVTFIYKEATASQMTEITHLPKTPWHKTKVDKGMDALIDYVLALDEQSSLTPEEALERLRIQKELIADGRI